jgi:1-acyl-sn-glycerol-3-phosphate acyltransferase
MTSTPVPASPTVWLRSYIYFVAFLIWTVIASTIFLPLLLTQRTAFVAVRGWVNGIMFLARTIVGITSRVEGLENVPSGPVIIAAQHQASFETYRMFTVLNQPIFILKRELISIPLIGWYMQRAGFINIDRSAGAGAMRKMLREAKAALDAGRQVIVFPEGTRVPTGESRPYQPGVAGLYSYCKVPVVPMALNSGYFWGKTRVLKMPGEIVFKFLPPLPGDLDKDTVITELKSRLESVKL